MTVKQRDCLDFIWRRALRLISGSLDYEMQYVLCDIEPAGLRPVRSFFSPY